MPDKNANSGAINRRGALKLGGASAMTLMMSGALQRALAANDAPVGQVIIGLSQEPTVFNPLMPHIEVDDGVSLNVFDPLYFTMPDGTFKPALAKEVPTIENGGISEDGLTWRIRLREGVTWHDGEPFTAEDVKYTLELLADPKFRAMSRVGHEKVRNIKVISDLELTWEMADAFSPYKSILSETEVVPKHVLGKAPDPNKADFNNAPVGTGPYKWGEAVPGDHIRLTANKDYWGEGPHIETVIFKYIPDMTVLYTQFQTGTIDVIGLQGIPPNRFEEATKLEGKTAIKAPGGHVESFSLNMGRPQFQDLAVRQALYHAMDKKGYIDVIYYGLPDPIESYVPKQNYYYNPNLPRHEYSIEKANKILDDAGWARGSDGIRAKDGVRLSFTNSTTSGNQTRQQAQQYLKQAFSQVGVEMTIHNLPPAVMWGEYYQMSQFDTIIVGIHYLQGSDPDVSNRFMSTNIPAEGGAGMNIWQYKNEEVDALLKEGAETFGQEKRREIYSRVQEIIRHDLPLLPIYQYADLRGYKSNLVGYTPNIALRIQCWNINEWHWT